MYRLIIAVAQSPRAPPARRRILNDRQELDSCYRLPGALWRKAQASAEISAMNHNVLGNFLDVRPALCACGNGKATFKNFRYWPQVKAPAAGE